ncbi:MAG: phage major tail tube protein [Rhizobiaceae bacterium]|nr:phage major tail tube protein [Rhizobiaceae bacterium]
MDNIIRGANWYVDEINMRLRAESTKLPVLRRDMVPFVLGGGYFSLELPAEIAALTAEMSVNSTPPEVRSRFGREPGDWTTVTYYESLLNAFPNSANGTSTGATTGGPKLKGRVVILKGLLNEVEQPGVKGMKADGPARLRWSSIIQYQDVVDGTTVHKFDVQNNTLIINGVNYTAEHNRIIAA